jgi:hypothetical protein
MTMRTHVTRAAEGFDRRSFTVAEILRMQAYDRDLKAQLYARRGFKQFRAIDTARRVTFVHQGPQGERRRSITERGPGEALIIAALPDFSARLTTI